MMGGPIVKSTPLKSATGYKNKTLNEKNIFIVDNEFILIKMKFIWSILYQNWWKFIFQIGNKKNLRLYVIGLVWHCWNCKSSQAWTWRRNFYNIHKLRADVQRILWPFQQMTETFVRKAPLKSVKYVSPNFILEHRWITIFIEFYCELSPWVRKSRSRKAIFRDDIEFYHSILAMDE